MGAVSGESVKDRTERVHILDIPITNIEKERLREHIFRAIKTREKASLVFVNVDVVIKAEEDEELTQMIRDAEYVLADGMPLIWISRLYGRPLKEKISGSDFIPYLCEKAVSEDVRFFLLGGLGDTTQKAKKALEENYPGIRVAGVYAPPIGFEKDQREVEYINCLIRQAEPDILVVCLGCPKQEKFIYANREKYDVPVSVCAGATIDFLAGNVKRCPKWVSRCGLEWFYRFLREPKRLFRRYFVDDMRIFGLVIRYWKEEKRRG